MGDSTFFSLSWKLLSALHPSVSAPSDDVSAFVESASQCPVLKHSDKVKAQVAEAEQLSKDLVGTEKSKVLPRLHKLNKQLEPVVFLVDNHLSAADLAVFAAVAPTVAEWKDADFQTFCNIARWYDLVQHQAALTPVVTDAKVFAIFKKNIPKVDPKEQQKKQEQQKGKEQKGQQKGQQQKGGEQKAQKAQPAKAAEKPDDIYRCDIRVGKIVDVEKHPSADALYKEIIDFGEATPRTVVSGLVKYVPIEEMKDRFVVCLLNLKAANMRAAHPTDELRKELLDPPAGSKPGDKIFFEGHIGEPDNVINLSSKGNIFSKLQPELKTNESFVACWQGLPMKTDKGEVTVKSVSGVIG